MSCERCWHHFGWVGLCLALLVSGLWAGPQNKTPGNKDRMVELDGLKSMPPAEWVEERPDRAGVLKSYRLEPIGDDKDPARVTIATYPRGTRPTAAEQVKRWQAQFLPPERKQMKDVATVKELKVAGRDVTYLDVRGDYREVANDPASIRPGYRLLGVYFDT